MFTYEIIATSRLNFKEMSKSEVDLIVLANLEASQHHGEELTCHHTKVCKIHFFFFMLLVLSTLKALLLITINFMYQWQQKAFTFKYNFLHIYAEYCYTLHALPLPGWSV